jgi:hypothetical protein
VEVVALTPVVPPAVVVVSLVVVVCAKAVLSAIALTAPTANILLNRFCFMFVLWFG